MGSITKWLPQIIIVNLDDLRVLVRTTGYAALIIGVDSSNALSSDVVRCRVGLTTTGDSSTTASHHFDEVVGGLFATITGFTNLLKEGAHISHSVGYRNT